MLIIFFDIKEFVLSSQTVNSAYYYEDLWQPREDVQRLHPELWLQKSWLLHHNNELSQTSFFTTEFFTKDNITVGPHPSYLPVSPIEDKTEGLPF
jgi:hypothetical protein